ncbi:MAG: M20/M25/M40 family metallo-hydrolase [Chloroflexi bacterium]|nr:M20/M25/M40 family metallo-hydrolase [Chloroflexota bacterium]
MSGRLLLIPAIACLAFAIACTSGGEGPGGTDTAFDVDRALAHAEVLAVDIGSRPAGSANELAAADYIRAELASYGYEAELQPFPIETYEAVRSDLSVTYADGSSEIEATPLFGSASGTETEQLISAGLGYPGDFPAEAAGSIVLIERGEIEFSSKVANAEEAGAVAAVIYNDASGPFVGQLSETPGIPVLSIAREDGESLLDLMLNETLTATVDVEINVVSGESQNVVARPADGPCRIVVGGHYDSVPAGPGANDNGSGTAVVVELARTLAANGGGDVCFALFGAEEIGLVGSLAYIAALSPDELSGIEAMLNFDMLAVGTSWPLVGSTALVDLAGEVAEELAIPYDVSPSEPGGSDHAPFIEAGVPAVIFNCFCDSNYHTASDRFDFLERQRLEEAGALGLGLLEALLAA